MCKCAEDWTGILEIRIYSASHSLPMAQAFVSQIFAFSYENIGVSNNYVSSQRVQYGLRTT